MCGTKMSLQPLARRRRTRWVPRKPAPPVTTILFWERVIGLKGIKGEEECPHDWGHGSLKGYATRRRVPRGGRQPRRGDGFRSPAYRHSPSFVRVRGK